MHAFVKSTLNSKYSIKTQTIASLIAIVGAVVIPQVFHLIGIVSGAGTAPGEVFLPMHLPIILVGLISGPYAGAIAGLLGPVVSSSITGMPGQRILPFMMFELFGYGVVAGSIRNLKFSTITKVILTQIGGRACRVLAILAAILIWDNQTLKISSVLDSVITGLPGLIVQWILIPLLMFRIGCVNENE